jgi:hypothetical protein
MRDDAGATWALPMAMAVLGRRWCIGSVHGMSRGEKHVNNTGRRVIYRPEACKKDTDLGHLLKRLRYPYPSPSPSCPSCPPSRRSKSLNLEEDHG